MPTCPECNLELDYQEEDYDSGSWYICVPCKINVCIRPADEEVVGQYEDNEDSDEDE